MKSDQFQRTILLLGKDGFEHLQQAHITVVGCGAVGGFAVEALARAGIKNLTLIDGDTVESSNINRQLCALHSTLGQYKTLVLRKRILDICPEVKVTTHETFLHADNARALLSTDTNYIIDAIDSIPDKVVINLYAKQNHIPLISSMGAAMRTDPNQIKIAPLNQTSVCPLAARMRKLVKTQGGNLSVPCVFSTESPAGTQMPGRQMGSLVTLTGIFGLILANEVIKRIAK